MARHPPRSRMLTALATVCIAGAAFAAHAESGSFGVNVRVLPRQSTAPVRVDLPLPANARQITGHASGGSYECPGELHATSAFYRTAMQDRGYRLVADHAHPQGVRLHFARDDQRVEIRLQPVLGGMPTLRMIVVATAPT